MKDTTSLAIYKSICTGKEYYTIDGTKRKSLGSGLEYSQISNKILELSEEGYLITEEDILKLTPKGLDMLDRLNTKCDRTKWIEPYESSRIKKIDINHIYIPVKKEEL